MVKGSSVQELFASYLSSRAQFVQIECSRSSLRELNCGVPQGLSWASVICFVHRSPVADIIKRHNPTISMLMTLSSICHLN